jgi:hypothetical protein
LNALSDAFHGVLPPRTAWRQLLEIANKALVTPSLRQALVGRRQLDAIPPDAAEFLALVDDLNRERNLKLRAMALDAVEAVNAAGITPVFLKGMALWASRKPFAPHDPRMMSDVDLLVRPDEAQTALVALQARGFNILKLYPENSPHVVAELWRKGDVGALDLHRRPPGPPGPLELFDAARDTEETCWPGRVRAPLPAHQIYLTCVHDMLHDDGFWRGGFDVRHLCDIADLADRSDPVDWAVLLAPGQSRFVRDAVLSELVAAHRIVGASLPEDMVQGLIPRFHYRRHRLQYAHPLMHFPLVMLGMAVEAAHLVMHRSSVERPAGAEAGSRRRPRLGERIARIGQLARPREAQSRPNRL